MRVKKQANCLDVYHVTPGTQRNKRFTAYGIGGRGLNKPENILADTNCHCIFAPQNSLKGVYKNYAYHRFKRLRKHRQGA